MKKFLLIFGLMIVSTVMLASCGEPHDGKYAELAKCLTKEGVKFYGAFWCPHCQEQKAIFGDDMRYVTYIECDARDPKGKPEQCAEAKIDRYPSWFFPGQGVETGLHQPEALAKKAGCDAALNGSQQTTKPSGNATAPATTQSGTQAPAENPPKGISG